MSLRRKIGIVLSLAVVGTLGAGLASAVKSARSAAERSKIH